MELRHRNLIHIQKALSPEGTLWMNTVRINREDVKQMVYTTMPQSAGMQPKKRGHLMMDGFLQSS